jgi:hypothetical protein
MIPPGSFMAFSLFILTFCLSLFSESHAQTVSIVNMDGSREAILLEAGLKHILRTQGYTVKGVGTEGYVILLHGMSANTTQGMKIGVVGSAVVARVLRKESAVHLLPDKKEIAHKDFIDKFTAIMGSPVVYLAGTTGIGDSPEKVAEVLSLYIHNVLRGTLLQGGELIRTLENGVYPMR